MMDGQDVTDQYYKDRDRLKDPFPVAVHFCFFQSAWITRECHVDGEPARSSHFLVKYLELVSIFLGTGDDFLGASFRDTPGAPKHDYHLGILSTIFQRAYFLLDKGFGTYAEILAGGLVSCDCT